MSLVNVSAGIEVTIASGDWTADSGHYKYDIVHNLSTLAPVVDCWVPAGSPGVDWEKVLTRTVETVDEDTVRITMTDQPSTDMQVYIV